MRNATGCRSLESDAVRSEDYGLHLLPRQAPAPFALEDLRIAF